MASNEDNDGRPKSQSNLAPQARSWSQLSPCAMSVDVEDYFQVWAFSDVIKRKSWNGFALRTEKNVYRILDLLDQRHAKATFFTLGWVAERAPGLVKEITQRGHELASHGYDHKKVFEQTPAEFREDVAKTKALLEDIGGVRVSGYRAPGFSIDGRAPWAYDVLRRCGHLYSSSSHPIAHDHYGDPNGLRAPFRPISGSNFVEAPVATAKIFGRRLSCAGGGWFRAAPYSVSKRLMENARKNLDGPMIFYFHPWEIDPDQPRITTASLKSKFRHYFNLGAMETKLDRLLLDYQWERIDTALSHGAARAAA